MATQFSSAPEDRASLESSVAAFNAANAGGTGGTTAALRQRAEGGDRAALTQLLTSGDPFAFASALPGFRQSSRLSAVQASRRREVGPLNATAVQKSIQNIPDEVLTDIELEKFLGTQRNIADRASAGQVQRITARTGGDTSSPEFQFLSSAVRGGAAADLGARNQELRLTLAREARTNQVAKAQLLAGLLGQQQNFQLGQEGQRLQGQQISNQFTLGQGQLELGQERQDLAEAGFERQGEIQSFELAGRFPDFFSNQRRVTAEGLGVPGTAAPPPNTLPLAGRFNRPIFSI